MPPSRQQTHGAHNAGTHKRVNPTSFLNEHRMFLPFLLLLGEFSHDDFYNFCQLWRSVLNVFG